MTKSNGVEELEVCLKVVEYPRPPSLGLYFATFGGLETHGFDYNGRYWQPTSTHFGLFQLPVKSHLILFCWNVIWVWHMTGHSWTQEKLNSCLPCKRIWIYFVSQHYLYLWGSCVNYNSRQLNSTISSRK